MNRLMKALLAGLQGAVAVLGAAVAGEPSPGPRRVISLDGTWEIAQGSLDRAPRIFDRRVPVPGLADMARPAFAEVGTAQSGQHRQAFWCRRTFSVDGTIPEVARLKIHKAMFGTRVLVNGRLVGEHLPCFTPAELDVREYLHGSGRTNELLVRVGAHRNVLPKGMPDGADYEKFDYIPGIYDSVELVLCGRPRVVNVQTVPDLAAGAVRVVAEIEGPAGEGGARSNRVSHVGNVPHGLTCRVREVSTGKVVGSAQGVCPASEGTKNVELRVAIEGCRPWSPEDPFLYELEVATGGDMLRTRFGMRTFRLDPKIGKAVLNGKPYPLRGTNVCIFRFFEDPKRGDLPWREEWVRRLHRAFRSMHWNSIRYCIGFPPELWYRVADEEGLLVQDEFPVWGLAPETKSDALVKEYTEWMRERWNHPCVVIWDAQNETVTAETGKAIQAVRHLDLSGRPWDNGWSPPEAPGDVYEAHPYVFASSAFRPAHFAFLPGDPGAPGVPQVFVNAGRNPVIINEYGWGQLDREGNATIPMMAQFYERFLGPKTTVDQRREFRARTMAYETEFWRCRRQVAGVLHFCGLAYSRPKAVTSDHFLDIEKLNFEPYFQTYVGDAFAPVGLMIDHWAEELPAGRSQRIPVVVINDLSTDWQGTVRLRLLHGQGTVVERAQPCRVKSLGTARLEFDMAVPAEPGRYQWVAERIGPADDRPVRSLRDFAAVRQSEWHEEIARGKPVAASSSVTVGGQTYPAAAAVDGNPWTRWSSEFSDPQWIAVDLGQPTKISQVELNWEAAYGKAYAIQVSQDGKTWKDVFTTQSGKGGRDVIRFTRIEARWVRMSGTQRSGTAGYSLWEFKVFQ